MLHVNKVMLHVSVTQHFATFLQNVKFCFFGGIVSCFLNDEKIKKISDEISDMAFEYLMKFGVDISPVVTNIDHFNYWVDNLPYYRNVRDEGVRLSA